MPKLTTIWYRLFECDESVVAAAAKNETHDFGSELVLAFQGGEKLFISWVSEPVQYSIGTKETSHFMPDAPLTDHDVSASEMWAGLIGQEVSLSFIGSDNQVLEISSPSDCVLVCSYEPGGWWADELTICRQAPPPDDG